jgi:hypothetical protein
MAGRTHRGDRDTAGSSRGVLSLDRTAASAVASGSDTATPMDRSQDSTAALQTRATYRNLIMRGLAPDEAANLTAFMAGIAVGDTHWTLRQINQLLFLREMNRSGKLADASEAASN